MYYKDKDYNERAPWVNQLEVDTADYNIVGDIWIIEKVPCKEDVCPYFIRAREQKTRGLF